jgi:hypothetical protein
MEGRTVVKCTCPDCGDVQTTAGAITLRLAEGEATGQYRFNCPQCNTIVLKSASETIVNLLKAAFVKIETVELPLELMERPLDGTLDPDAIIDFQLAVEDGSLFDKITKRGNDG